MYYGNIAKFEHITSFHAVQHYDVESSAFNPLSTTVANVVHQMQFQFGSIHNKNNAPNSYTDCIFWCHNRYK